MGIGSFFAGLGKGALKIGTGNLLGGIGEIAGGIAGGRAAGRAQEAGINNNADYLRLQGAKLNLDAPQLRANNSVRGDLLANLQPLSVNGPITHTGGKMPSISGGMSPALLSPNSRQLGQGMSREALLSQMNGPAFTPTPQPKAGMFDHILNGIGYAGLGANVLGGLSHGGAPRIADMGPVDPYQLPGYRRA